ncbi:MAG: KH domain-containing protein, partial [Acholeplasmataceae bacterium]
MGQKVSPKGLRVGINKNWDSSWYADSKDVPALVKEDHEIREYLNKVYVDAEVSLTEIERVKAKSKDRIKLTLFTARPGMVIGRDAEIKNKVVSTLEHMTKKEVILNVVEVARPE